MANQVFNIALGRVAQLAIAARDNNPAGSTLVIDVIAAANYEGDAAMKDKVTFADIVSGATNWVTQAGIRKTVTTLTTVTVTHGTDRVDVDIPDQTWSSVPAGDGWHRLVIGYAPTTPTDANTIPLTMHDFVGTPNGGNITATIANFFGAT